MTTHYNYNPEGVPLSHHEDSEEQLVIGSERDFIDLQEPELVRSIGAAALRRAQEQLGVAGMDVADAGLKWTGWSFAAGWKLRN